MRPLTLYPFSNPTTTRVTHGQERSNNWTPFAPFRYTLASSGQDSDGITALRRKGARAYGLTQKQRMISPRSSSGECFNSRSKAHPPILFPNGVYRRRQNSPTVMLRNKPLYLSHIPPRRPTQMYKRKWASHELLMTVAKIYRHAIDPYPIPVYPTLQNCLSR